ncbi:uncharacterized protein LOC111683239 [Lucilia cuprina]|uniref:uncharacterized protein LOC111683239 n=1 Tax=Lucilia cuprina TaxID=7375 RepID=UPI001F067DB7|nr:uncharacterized protein LOC111683239 [Lucilia cuprina]
MTTLIFSITLMLISGELCLAWRSFNIRFDTTECKQNNKMTDFLNCSIVKLKRNQEVFNMNVRFNTKLIKPKLDFWIINERPDEKDFVLVNFTNVDGCLFLQNKDTYNILQIIRKEFEKYSNLPEKCPVEKLTHITVKQLKIDPDSFPPYIPETKFRVEVYLKEDLYEYINSHSAATKITHSNPLFVSQL